MRNRPIPPKCWGGVLTYSMDKAETWFDAMKTWHDTIQTENESAWILMISNQSKVAGYVENDVGELISCSMKKHYCSSMGISDQQLLVKRDTRSFLISASISISLLGRRIYIVQSS
jgi:hypothetical protein